MSRWLNAICTALDSVEMLAENALGFGLSEQIEAKKHIERGQSE